jgi:hypothetical protein
MSADFIWVKGLRCEGCAVLRQLVSASLPKPLPFTAGEVRKPLWP